jgi:hypothetical protein
MLVMLVVCQSLLGDEVFLRLQLRPEILEPHLDNLKVSGFPVDYIELACV